MWVLSTSSVSIGSLKVGVITGGVVKYGLVSGKSLDSPTSKLSKLKLSFFSSVLPSDDSLLFASSKPQAEAKV